MLLWYCDDCRGSAYPTLRIAGLTRHYLCTLCAKGRGILTTEEAIKMVRKHVRDVKVRDRLVVEIWRK